MMRRTVGLAQRIFVSVLAMLLLVATVPSQTKVKPGFNLFSVEQDVEMGQEATKEIEKQIHLLNDRVADRYIADLGLKLAKNSQMPDLPWQFKVVNASEVNAFALPGGFVYVNRGLIEAAGTEGELAGVLGHEISHVTLRHGTNQLTKAYLAQAPLALLGGLGGGGWQAAIAKMGLGVAINSMFLKFSRKAETQADIIGTQVLHAAGYDLRQMTKMFETLRELQGRDPSKLEQFFSSHPAPKNRIERINKEIALLPPVRNPTVTTRRFRNVRARLKKMPPPPKAKPQPSESGRNRRPEPPSREFQVYRHPQRWYELPYPSNWEFHENDGSSILVAPEGGIWQVNNQSQLAYGVIIDVFEPRLSGRSRSLQEATDQLVAQLRRANRHLQPVGSSRRGRVSGADVIRVMLEGSPPGHEYEERVFLVTRWMRDNLLYQAFVAPKDDFSSYQATFSRMMRGLRVLR